jgi:hypothetical protein
MYTQLVMRITGFAALMAFAITFSVILSPRRLSYTIVFTNEF